MGVGNPSTLIRGVACGIDMFDCVLPRTARKGTAFSHEGRMNLKNALPLLVYRSSLMPAPALSVPGGYSRAHQSPGQTARDAGWSVASMHNIYFLLELMRGTRKSVISTAIC